MNLFPDDSRSMKSTALAPAQTAVSGRVESTHFFSFRTLSRPQNVLTIDLEDWFHVSNFESYLDRNS